jgi:signal transduction histidine kinase
LIDLRDALVSRQPLIRSLVGRSIDIHLDIGVRPAPVSVDPSQLEQAILNLVSNARDAMPLGGELTLAVRVFSECLPTGGSEAAEHAALIVTDTGDGISPTSMRHLFEPFYTTKAPGKGAGLGLAMVHGFVAQSGGHVVVTSPRGQGATVELHFPLARGLVSTTQI